MVSPGYDPDAKIRWLGSTRHTTRDATYLIKTRNSTRPALIYLEGFVSSLQPSRASTTEGLPRLRARVRWRAAVAAAAVATAAAALAPGPSAGCASMGDSGAEARHRAKVYCLNEDGQWDDRGTGHAAVQYMPVSSPADRPLLLPQPHCAIAGQPPETAACSVPAFAPGLACCP